MINKKFRLLRLGVFLFYFGWIIPALLGLPDIIIIDVILIGLLLFWIFSRCPNCKHTILEYYGFANPLKQLLLFFTILTFNNIECPICGYNKKENKLPPLKETVLKQSIEKCKKQKKKVKKWNQKLN